MTILDNTVPINIGYPPDFITDANFQALESYPYTSGNTVSSTDGVWLLGGGTLPQGLIVVPTSGIVTGVVSPEIEELLSAAIGVYPGEFITNGTDQPTYTFASGEYLTKTYSFIIHGLNTSTSSPPSIGSYTITTLKDWVADVDSWNALGDDRYTLGQK